jgi:hypothetical protein
MQPDRIELDAEQDEPTVDCERGHIASDLVVAPLPAANSLLMSRW